MPRHLYRDLEVALHTRVAAVVDEADPLAVELVAWPRVDALKVGDERADRRGGGEHVRVEHTERDGAEQQLVARHAVEPERERLVPPRVT